MDHDNSEEYAPIRGEPGEIDGLMYAQLLDIVLTLEP